jgi:hypothetical protein
MLAIAQLALAAAISAGTPTAENPVFTELTQKGVTMSDGSAVKLTPPIVPDGLDAAAQRAALAKAADARNPVQQLLQNSYYAPVIVKVRTVKQNEGEGPAVRTLDVWFVAHGDWKTLTAKDFLESTMQTKDEGQSRIVSKSGALSDEEIAKRKLTATTKEGREERFVYSTFSLLDRVEISATRFAVLASGKDSVLAAARLDPRFDKDPQYPNQWRALLRDERAEIKPGPPHLLAHSGGYAKITRLMEPAGAVFIEFHLVYEEPYGWFDGVNLVAQKARPMITEKVKTFRRKLGAASEGGGGKREKE